jgi:tetratricopeptide (TPR) repeat protein
VKRDEAGFLVVRNKIYERLFDRNWVVARRYRDPGLPRDLIEIREDVSRPSGVVVRIDGYDYPTTIAAPFEAGQESELDWYFEEHVRLPFTDTVRARQAGESVSAYGEALFRQLVASDEAREAYRALKTRSYPDQLAITVIGSPVFQALHWEALKDPRLPRPFALDTPIVRRGAAVAPEARASASPTLNLLVVTARPAGAYDVGYRAITRPLVATLRQARLRVDVDFVRPGTWQALVERLEAATRDRGAGYYHVIHFDLHGGLLTHADFMARQTGFPPADGLTTHGRWGRRELAPYDGVKGFLSFEPFAGDASGLVEAGEIADLLLKHKIPIAILTSGQSGKQVGEQESSLAARLWAAGTHSVLGMAWSVTISAAERLIPTLYGELFAGRSLGAAVLAGRRTLYADKTRRAAFNETIELEDWLLPVVYQNREPALIFRAFTEEDAKNWYAEEAARSPEPEPEYGFFGRDLDVLRIETALLNKRNLLLVQGMGGSGKTTLLKHLAHWWELTGLVEGSFYFGWDERAWTRGQILRALAPNVGLAASVLRAFDAISEAAQQQAVAAALRARRYLIIFDNLESVTGAPLAIPHSLDEAGRQQLRGFLVALAGGASLVLLGSRGDEGWLAAGSFADNVHLLEGLDPGAASDLADAVLRRAGAQNRRTESAFRELMTLLAGYPLALQIVLPHLAAKSAAEVLDELRQGLAEADAVTSGSDPVMARTPSLMTCIDYSHGHLDPEAQALLACFAPFTGFINTMLLDRYQKALGEEPALAGLPIARLGEVLEGARGLVQRDGTVGFLLRPQPALSWFLTQRLAAADQTERHQAIERAYRKLYDEYADLLSRLQQAKDDPEERQLGQFLVEQEYANLGTALRLALDQQASILSFYLVLSRHLDRLQDDRRGLELGELVLTRLEHLPREVLTGPRGAEFVGVIDDIATRQLQLHQLDRARTTYERALAVLDDLDGLDPRKAALLRASTFHQLGRVAQAQRRFEEAGIAYKKALNTQAFDDRHSAAITYHQLGTLAQDQRRFDEAEAAYKRALEIYIAFDDRHSAATTYHQLGTVAQQQRRFDEAEAAYKHALEIYVAFNDRYQQAGTYHQLGTVAAEQRRFDEAEAAYNRALEIKLAFDDRHGAADTYHQLGTVALEQRRFDEAAVAYRQALEIFVTLQEDRGAAIVFHSLARLWGVTGSASIPAAVASVMNIKRTEAKRLLKKLSS